MVKWFPWNSLMFVFVRVQYTWDIEQTNKGKRLFDQWKSSKFDFEEHSSSLELNDVRSIFFFGN